MKCLYCDKDFRDASGTSMFCSYGCGRDYYDSESDYSQCKDNYYDSDQCELDVFNKHNNPSE